MGRASIGGFGGAFAATALAIAAAGCGAGYQALHESDVRFEHCYRLDDEPAVSAPSKRACWQNWLGEHASGQPRDRLDYAGSRLVALSSGPDARLAWAGREPRVVAPAPTSAFAPPPHTLAPPKGGPAEPAAPAACSADCVARFASCAAACAADACREGCAERHRGCLRTCL